MCPLIWMFHGRSLNKTKRRYERAFRITYNGNSSPVQDLLDRDNSVTTHHRNIKNLATETYRFLQGLLSCILNEVFVEQDCYFNLRGNNFLNRRRVNALRYGIESVLFLAPKIWDILLKEMENV